MHLLRRHKHALWPKNLKLNSLILCCLSLFLSINCDWFIRESQIAFLLASAKHHITLHTHIRTFVSTPSKALLICPFLYVFGGFSIVRLRSIDSSDLSLDAVLSEPNKLGRDTGGESIENSYTFIILSRCSWY